MISSAAPWSPLGLADSAPLRARIGEIVGDWSQDWFPRLRLAIGRWELAVGDPWSGVEGVRVQGRALGLARGERASQRLYERAFDTDLSGTPLTDADRRVTDDFAEQMLHDLAVRIEAGLGLRAGDPSPGPKTGGVKIALSDEAGAALIWLVAPLSAVAPFCRAALPPARPPSEALQPRRTAVAADRLKLEAVLGHVELTIGDLKSLALGDVLVLDRALDEPAQLREPRTGRVVLAGDLTPLEADMALRLRPA